MVKQKNLKALNVHNFPSEAMEKIERAAKKRDRSKSSFVRVHVTKAAEEILNEG